MPESGPAAGLSLDAAAPSAGAVGPASPSGGAGGVKSGPGAAAAGVVSPRSGTVSKLTLTNAFDLDDAPKPIEKKSPRDAADRPERQHTPMLIVEDASVAVPLPGEVWKPPAQSLMAAIAGGSSGSGSGSGVGAGVAKHSTSSNASSSSAAAGTGIGHSGSESKSSPARGSGSGSANPSASSSAGGNSGSSGSSKPDKSPSLAALSQPTIHVDPSRHDARQESGTIDLSSELTRHSAKSVAASDAKSAAALRKLEAEQGAATETERQRKAAGATDTSGAGKEKATGDPGDPACRNCNNSCALM